MLHTPSALKRGWAMISNLISVLPSILLSLPLPVQSRGRGPRQLNVQATPWNTLGTNPNAYFPLESLCPEDKVQSRCTFEVQVFEAGSCYVAYASPKLLPPPPECGVTGVHPCPPPNISPSTSCKTQTLFH